VPNRDPAPTANVALSTPVLPVTVHKRAPGPDEGITRPADGVTVQDVSVVKKPVPEMDTVVPGSAPTGGEPSAGLGLTSVTAGLTVKAAVPEASP